MIRPQSLQQVPAVQPCAQYRVTGDGLVLEMRAIQLVGADPVASCSSDRIYRLSHSHRAGTIDAAAMEVGGAVAAPAAAAAAAVVEAFAASPDVVVVAGGGGSHADGPPGAVSGHAGADVPDAAGTAAGGGVPAEENPGRGF